MLILGSKAGSVEPVRLDGGAVVECRVLGTIEHDAAQVAASRKMAAVREGAGALEDVGIDVAAMLASPILMEGLAHYLFRVEIAMLAIVSWAGIGDGDGSPVDVSRETVALLLKDATVARRIEAVALSAHHEALDEGKGLPPSPNGGARAEQATATTAGSRTPPAPGARSAPTDGAVPSMSTS